MRLSLNSAHAIALLALFLALGSGVYAAAKINGSKIKKESIAGPKLKDDTITGTQVNEGSLGKVPSAQNADTAQTAQNALTAQTAQSADTAQTAQSADTAQTAQSADTAQTLAGTGPGGFVSSGDVRRFRFAVTVPSGGATVEQTVLDMAPLKLIAECNWADGPPFALYATTSAENAGIDIGYVRNANTSSTHGGAFGATRFLLVGLPGGGQDRVVGDIVYNDPQTTISIPFIAFSDDGGSRQFCFFTGTATRVVG
jgi:hypothetical protein